MKNTIPEIKAALQLAKAAHAGQLRAMGEDIGKPYFDTHVMRVVRAVPIWAQAAAALHDVIEDTHCEIQTLCDLQPTLLPSTVDAVILLTRRPGVDYAEYIERIATNDSVPGAIARAVKLADLADNLATAPESGLRGRYIRAMGRIATAIDTQSSKLLDTSVL